MKKLDIERLLRNLSEDEILPPAAFEIVRFLVRATLDQADRQLRAVKALEQIPHLLERLR